MTKNRVPSSGKSKNAEKATSAGKAKGDGVNKSNHLNASGLGKKPKAMSSAQKEEKKFAFEEDARPRLNLPPKQTQVQPLQDMRMGELEIERLGHDGRGIAYWNNQIAEQHQSVEKKAHFGKIVFVAQTLPGEKVSARLVKEHSRYIEARVQDYLVISPKRQTPACAHFGVCGGCQLQHLQNSDQLVFKQESLIDQLGKALTQEKNLSPKKILAPITSASFGYRRAARFAVSYLNGLAIGFREENSREVVSIQSCSVMTQPLGALIKPLQELMKHFVESQAITHIEVIDAQPMPSVVFRAIKKISNEQKEVLERFENTFRCKVFIQAKEGNQLESLDGSDISPRLHYPLQEFGLSLEFHPRDFIQVNEEVNQKMVQQAVALLQLKSTDRVLDLFCGIGNFTLVMAKQCQHVIGIEAVETMVERGIENARANKIENATFIASDLTKLTENRLKQVCGKIDAVLLDPPREGAKEILTKVIQLAPSRILYVSCNPATLARDAKLLTAAGFQLDSLGAIDMFPQTAHLESMALFVRKK